MCAAGGEPQEPDPSIFLVGLSGGRGDRAGSYLEPLWPLVVWALPLVGWGLGSMELALPSGVSSCGSVASP